MKLVDIYFNELELDLENKFYLGFFQNCNITNFILFSTKNNYFITSMKCYIKINPNTSQTKKFKLTKELSDTAQELNSNGPNVFFNIKSINHVADTVSYLQSNEWFDLVPNKQKLFVSNIDYFDTYKERVN